MAAGEPALYLLDGNSLLYRAYYAIRTLATSRGFPTNAIYGFLLTLRKLLAEERPAYMGVVFDVKGPTVRHEIDAAYKAKRKPMPEDLQAQVPVLKDILSAYGIPLFELPGYEADDILGSLARKASKKGFLSTIVSTDKDMLQLIGDRVRIYRPVSKKDGAGNKQEKEIIDGQNAEAYFGVKASQVLDVMILWGSPSDNVGGVRGVGEKTAKDLIREFGSLDNLLRNLPRVKNPRLRKALADNPDQIELSRRLVTIETGLDVPFDPEALRLGPPDSERLAARFRELEFTSFLNETAASLPEHKAACELITDEAALRDLARNIRRKGFVSLDTETDNLLPTQARLVGMSFCLEPGRAFYLPLRHDLPGSPPQIETGAALGILKEVLSDPDIAKIGQNIKYDAIVLAGEGAELRGIDLDSTVLSYLLEPNWGKHDKVRLAEAYLGVRAVPYAEIAGKGKDEKPLNAVPVGRVAPYACQDADLALRLGRLLWERVREEKLDALYRDLERPLIEVLADMERHGVRLDPRALKALDRELAADMDGLRKKIFESAGVEFNLNSPRQLGQVLFEKLNLPSGRRTKITKGYSTSFDVLQDLAPLSEVARYALEYRQLAKLKSGYAEKLPGLINPRTGRVHTSYNQTVAATGRLSSSDPNLQNIPARGEMGRRFRQAFIPDNGHVFLAADYSQIELRVLAHLSEDPALIEAFLRDRDIHAETARLVFGDDSPLSEAERRRRAKVINFSLIYGASAFSLARELGTSNAEAQAFIDRYFQTFPKVRDYLEDRVREAEETGFSTTLFGRRRPVPELKLKDNAARQAGRRMALNTPIQGTAADLMKKAMIETWRAIKEAPLGARLILQVHDELVFEVPEAETAAAEEIVRNKMENVFRLAVPLRVGLGWGINWAETKANP
ncbi:MAG: DNA polymerase I [Candidatus Aminicenantes bacterium]|nr:DNA polymerase I [Candidatus Aminicenantes bacterium]